MYLAVNTPRHIATLDVVLLLTAYFVINQLLKCTGSPPHLLIRLHGPQIRSLILFWQPIIPLTSLSASIGPYLKQQRFWCAQILPVVITDNPILGVALRLLPRFTGDSTMQEV